MKCIFLKHSEHIQKNYTCCCKIQPIRNVGTNSEINDKFSWPIKIYFGIYKVDFSDGQFLIAMRCRCFLCNSVVMSMVFGYSYHRNQYDYFCSTIGTDCSPMVFPISEPMFGDDFLWETPKQRIYDRLTFATNFAYISALGINRRKIHRKWTNTK